jgi:general secretion pathway protein A
MYNSFYGFKERPFQLVPNPAYLFLSGSHEEAMAHLVYAISQGDGFVEMTGEVGTGKTTLCRAVLENLDKFTEAAYIFNPKLDSLQLLKAINDEFGISSQGDNTKDLIDTLNAFLMKKKVEGKKVVLIIDEAQNLSEDVLEQLRLLSNLETTTSKLLQIILVGQPELSEMLDSHDLRQLGQRITLSCHLNPLTYRETREYIQHRIQVASQKPEVKFTRGAYRAVYRYSGGIPRLINIACDRALLTAFGLNRKTVTGIIAKASIRELAGRGDLRRTVLRGGKKMPLSLGVLLGVLVAGLYLASIFFIIYRSVDMRMSALLESKELQRPKVTQKVETGREKMLDLSSSQASVSPPGAEGKRSDRVPEQSAPVMQAAKATPQGTQKQMSSEQAVGNFDDFLKSIDSRETRAHALTAVLELWIEEPEVNSLLDQMADDQAFFRIAAKQNGLQILRITEGLDLLRKLNLPAILELPMADNLPPKYVALVKMHQDDLTLSDPERGEVDCTFSQIKPYWQGVAYIPWKDFLGYEGVIPYKSSGDSVLSLKAFIRDLGYEGIEISPAYDGQTVMVVKGIQAKHGIRTDGLVGPLTKIALYNENRSLNIPRLVD